MWPPLAKTEDLEYRVGRTFTGDEISRVEAVLDDASALVRDEAGRSWVNPITGELADVPASIRTVVLRMAERVIRNPQGFKSESAGDYSYNRGDENEGVYLSERERQIIRRAIGRSGLWTQPIERDDPCDTTLWCEDNYGCELFPIGSECD